MRGGLTVPRRCVAGSASWASVSGMTRPIDRLVGVYRADGGLRGEVSYLLGHYLKGASCTLCDITHSPFRRKASWDAAVARLGIPFDLLHLNELDPELAVFVGDDAAMVVAETPTGRFGLLGNDDLKDARGDVEAFFARLRRALDEHEAGPFVRGA